MFRFNYQVPLIKFNVNLFFSKTCNIYFNMINIILFIKSPESASGLLLFDGAAALHFGASCDITQKDFFGEETA